MPVRIIYEGSAMIIFSVDGQSCNWKKTHKYQNRMIKNKYKIYHILQKAFLAFFISLFYFYFYVVKQGIFSGHFSNIIWTINRNFSCEIKKFCRQSGLLDTTSDNLNYYYNLTPKWKSPCLLFYISFRHGL